MKYKSHYEFWEAHSTWLALMELIGDITIVI